MAIRLLARARKLKAMPLAEVAERARYAALLSRERRAHRRGVLGSVGRLGPRLLPEYRGDLPQFLKARSSPEARFFASTGRCQEMRRLFATDHAVEAAGFREQASKAAAHEFSFFGQTFRYGDDVTWHRDPVSGAEWPVRYHADVPAEGGDRGFGDIKYVWELNRHQFLVDLAKSAFVDGSEAHATALNALHASWMDACPYGTGVPWACALEPAFRVFSWLWAYHMLLGAGLLSDGDHLRWLEGFHDHGHFLFRHLERWTSPYNHLAGEASALYQLGLLFPEFAEASVWRTRGRAVLEESLPWQFHSDGGSVEQSTFYHHATVGFYLLAALLGRINGEEFAPPVWAAIERGLDFSLHLRWPDGLTPSIGGGDDGKPIRLEHLPLWDFRYYLAIGAVVFDRPDFKRAAQRFWEDALWLLGPEGRERFEAMPTAPPETRRVFRESGYAIVRTDWSAEADFVCFDCGPQAGGLRRDDVPSAAHGHADCLSAVVALAGKRVLVDPGFYCYNCADGWEVHFRKTHVHNTLSVDERDQAHHVSKMAWSHTYRASWSETAVAAPSPHLGGQHDGFRLAPGAFVHRRQLWIPRPGTIVIVDVLDGRARAGFAVNFQFAPGLLRHVADRVVRFDDRFDLAWSSPRACRASVVEGGPLPHGGWIAESLGVRRSAPRLRISGEVPGSALALVSVLVDTHRVADGTTHLADLDRAVAGGPKTTEDVGEWLFGALGGWNA